MAVRDDIEVIKTLDGSCYCPCQDLTYRFEISLTDDKMARIRDRGCRKRLLDVHYAHPARAKDKHSDFYRCYVSKFRDLIYEVEMQRGIYDPNFVPWSRRQRNWRRVEELVKMKTLKCVFDADHSRHFWSSVDSDEESDG